MIPVDGTLNTGGSVENTDDIMVTISSRLLACAFHWLRYGR